MLLRPTRSGKFRLVGSCYIHGFSDTETLLGPLRTPWEVKFRRVSFSDYTPCFRNSVTEEERLDDPRLGSLPPDWVQLEAKLVREEPHIFARFRNNVTGQVMNSDPRMLPQALKERGVNLRKFQLV